MEVYDFLISWCFVRSRMGMWATLTFQFTLYIFSHSSMYASNKTRIFIRLTKENTFFCTCLQSSVLNYSILHHEMAQDCSAQTRRWSLWRERNRIRDGVSQREKWFFRLWTHFTMTEERLCSSSSRRSLCLQTDPQHSNHFSTQLCGPAQPIQEFTWSDWIK